MAGDMGIGSAVPQPQIQGLQQAETTQRVQGNDFGGHIAQAGTPKSRGIGDMIASFASSVGKAISSFFSEVGTALKRLTAKENPVLKGSKVIDNKTTFQKSGQISESGKSKVYPQSSYQPNTATYKGFEGESYNCGDQFKKDFDRNTRFQIDGEDIAPKFDGDTTPTKRHSALSQTMDKLLDFCDGDETKAYNLTSFLNQSMNAGMSIGFLQDGIIADSSGTPCSIASLDPKNVVNDISKNVDGTISLRIAYDTPLQQIVNPGKDSLLILDSEKSSIRYDFEMTIDLDKFEGKRADKVIDDSELAKNDPKKYAAEVKPIANKMLKDAITVKKAEYKVNINSL